MEEMPCGSTCALCPVSDICHSVDPDGPDYDPAELIYWLDKESE